MSELVTGTVRVKIRYFAGAGAAAKVDEEHVDVAEGSPVSGVLEQVGAHHGPDLTRVIAASSVLVDGVQDRQRSQPVRDGLTIDVLPPFAGG